MPSSMTHTPIWLRADQDLRAQLMSDNWSESEEITPEHTSVNEVSPSLSITSQLYGFNQDTNHDQFNSLPLMLALAASIGLGMYIF